MADRIKGRGRAFQSSAWCGSAIALATLGAGQARAQCAPSPSQQGQAVTCAGTQAGGYTISTEQSPLTVSAGASIQNGGDALTVSIPASSPYDYRSAAITVNGSIASSAGNGIAVSSGAPYPGYYDFTGTSATITVAVGASVSGTAGITLAAYPDTLSGYAPLNVSLDNSGNVAGTAGPALASTGNNARFSLITNEAGASLGAVAAAFTILVNNGTIDGGQSSALNNVPFYSEQSFTNTGTIQAEGSAATVRLANSSGFTNSGTISNTGGGTAVSSSGIVNNAVGGVLSANGGDVVTGTYLGVSNTGTIVNTGAGDALSGFGLAITNYAGATITAGSGGIAVNSTGSLQLTNSGTITGNVLAGSAGGYYSTLVDSSQGTITGNVTFDGTFNTLVATISGGSLQTGVSGSITGASGAGVTNTLEIATAQTTTLTSAVPLPSNFNQLQFAPAAGTTLTLGDGFSTTGTIAYTGEGALVNATTLSGNGQIVNGSGVSGTFTNSGTITSNNLGGTVALAFSSYASLNNSGTITATGDAVNGGYSFTNSGTISAGGTAVQDFAVGGFTNSGTISSSGGTALALSQSCTCSVAINSGTISGAQTGVALSDGVLNNSGTITATGYGVTLSFYGTLNNLAGGVINGGTAAIGDPGGTVSGAAVTNQGTINGDVDLASTGQYNFYSGNRYDAAPGGVLNGNLTLGLGDTLITDLVNTGSGQFAGISGTVTASNSNLVYNVSADAMIAAAPAGFGSVAYQLFANPTLTMAAGTTSGATLVLAGTGTVALNGAISTTNANAVNAQAGLVAASGYDITGTAMLTLANTGMIATTLTAPGTGINAALLLGGNTLNNSGSIALADNSGAGPVGNEAAVLNGSSITNSGTITGVNAGAITFGYDFYPYTNVAVLTNSGTLTSNAETIQIEYAATINNSGAIVSSGQTAIGLVPYSYDSGPILVDNAATGTITGSSDAIDLGGGTVRNAGTINGNVNLNYSAFTYTAGTYYDDGGTLNGNLTLNAAGALVIDLANQGTGPLGGVTGTITANGGALIYQVNASATTAGAPAGAGFGQTGFLIANDATLTLASGSQQNGAVGLAGTGSAILDGTITTTDTVGVATQLPSLLTATGSTSTTNALTVTNNGTIAVTADAGWPGPVAISLASSDTLINNGTITIGDSVVPGSFYTSAAVVGGLSVTNTGTISATNVSAVAPGASLINSGSIASNIEAIELVGITSITNSGTITSTSAAAIGGSAIYTYNVIPANVTNLAGGVITGAADAIDMAGGVVINTGTINGNVNLTSPYGYGFSGGYDDNGGTLNGNLTLTAGQVLLVDYGAATGPLGGVVGTINAQGASLLYNIASDTRRCTQGICSPLARRWAVGAVWPATARSA